MFWTWVKKYLGSSIPKIQIRMWSFGKNSRWRSARGIRSVDGYEVPPQQHPIIGTLRRRSCLRVLFAPFDSRVICGFAGTWLRFRDYSRCYAHRAKTQSSTGIWRPLSTANCVLFACQKCIYKRVIEPTKETWQINFFFHSLCLYRRKKLWLPPIKCHEPIK